MRRRVLGFLASATLGLALAAGAAARWLADPDASSLQFTAEQAGARFDGRFARFTPGIEFDPASPASGRFVVTVDLASVDTRDRERDETLRGAEFFDVARWPQARYATTGIRRLDDGEFAADGTLTIRGRAQPVALRFRFTTSPDGSARLDGSTTLRRLDFGIGAQGDWADSRWIGHDVELRFSVRLGPSLPIRGD